MSRRPLKYQTQWSAQFFAAAELTRRGYLVSLTLGNAPVVDLLVVSPTGTHFQVDVKGLSSRNFWLIRERPCPPDLFFILVHVPLKGGHPNFFVLPASTVMSEIANLRQKTLDQRKKWVDWGAGLNWGTAAPYQDRWDLLPQ